MANSVKIYVLEDDLSINELINYALKSNEFEVFSFYEPKEFFKALDELVPDILVLDIMLPNESGFSILNKLKNNPKTKDIQVLLLSALSSELDKVKGLDLGASDYITKPFSVLEFLARIRKLIRYIKKDNVIYINDLSIDETSRVVKIANKVINLTLKEYELLLLFVKNQNHCFSKDDLFEIVWGGVYSSRTVDIHINTLRAKLKNYANCIKTIHKIGYRFEKAKNLK